MTALTSDLARRLNVPAGTEGVVISDVEAGSPAQRAGLAPRDVLLQVNRRPVASVGDARARTGPRDVRIDRVPAHPAQRPGELRHGAQGVGALGDGVEREVKLRFPTAEDARARVLGLGLRPLRPRRLQHDVLVDTADRRLLAAGTALRVRSDGGRAYLTYKGPLLPGPLKARQEIETDAGSSDGLLAILAAVGFTPVFRYEKFREEYCAEGAVVARRRDPDRRVRRARG